MGKDPERIREEIEETRAQMGETVDAIGYKADVKTRVKDSISDKTDAVKGAVSEKKDAVVSTVTGVVPDTERVKEGARRGVGIAKENPIGLAVGGLAVGFLAGLLVPSTRIEDEKIGDVAQQVKETVKETGQEALDRGKQVAQEVGQTAMETARERGQEQGQELAASVRESAQQVAPSGTTGG